MVTRAAAASGAVSGGSSLSAHVGSLLLLVGGAFAVVSALLARQGFTGRDHGASVSLPSTVALALLCWCRDDLLLLVLLPSVVGVDLGTTYSVVAIAQRNNVSVIPDAFGHVIIPSIVAFLPHGGASTCMCILYM